MIYKGHTSDITNHYQFVVGGNKSRFNSTGLKYYDKVCLEHGYICQYGLSLLFN